MFACLKFQTKLLSLCWFIAIYTGGQFYPDTTYVLHSKRLAACYDTAAAAAAAGVSGLMMAVDIMMSLSFKCVQIFWTTSRCRPLLYARVSTASIHLAHSLGDNYCDDDRANAHCALYVTDTWHDVIERRHLSVTSHRWAEASSFSHHQLVAGKMYREWTMKSHFGQKLKLLTCFAAATTSIGESSLAFSLIQA